MKNLRQKKHIHKESYGNVDASYDQEHSMDENESGNNEETGDDEEYDDDKNKTLHGKSG